MGSKNRIAKYILPIILKDRKPDQCYIEPFVGGCNTMDKVDGIRIGNDSNEYLIALWKVLQDGWIPPSDVSREFYYTVKYNQSSYPPELVCFLAMPCSFGCKWWGGYAQNKDGRNYADVAKRSFLRQIKKLQTVMFTSGDYYNLSIPDNSIIYCDPPYQGTTQYKHTFDHNKFWGWCKYQSDNGHSVFISEYSAPKGFECVWEMTITSTLNKNSKDKKIEKLFKA